MAEITDYRQLLGKCRGEKGEPLFRLDEIGEGGTASIDGVYGFPGGLLVVRRGEEILVFVNICPHQGKPLDWEPGEFLNFEKTMILCEAHGALFRFEDGVCVEGPCLGEGLMKVPVVIRDGAAYAAEDAPG
jgi:nitrite reductase/ring-hydroxylating ferredoxin subunit